MCKTDAAVEVEVDEVDAKAQRKAAKRAAKAAAAAPEEEAPVTEKKAKKAKTTAKAEEAVAAVADEVDEVEAKRLRKAAKKAAKEATATEAAPEKEVDEAPPAKKAKVATPEVAPAKAPAAAEEDEEWKDNTYKCCDCSEDWVDTADDQQFRYDKGFAETPKRCKDCRWAKKVRMEGGDPTEKGKGKGKKGKDAGGNENTVFIRGLPFATTEEALNKDFGECGELVSCRMPLNDEGSCKGIAFIKFTDKAGMDKAIAFNETDYGGRTIFCVPAGDKPEGKGKDGKDKGKGKGKDKGKDKGKGKGKKGKASSESFAKNTGAMVESTGVKKAFEDSDDE